MARRRSNIAYWIAVLAAIAFTVIVCLKRKTIAEGTSLEWLIGGAVFLAILVHELIDSLNRRPRESNPSKAEQPAAGTQIRDI
jgi:NADH:ubiquinone oxidoreductase subunit 6 (subunit J)